MVKDGSITVPVFCERRVIMRIKLIPDKSLTNDEFVDLGLKVLARTILEKRR